MKTIHLTAKNTVRMLLTYILMLHLASPLLAGTPQELITIKGQVTSVKSKDPIPFVSVLEKGTKHGTKTDFNGNYTIQVSNAQSVLVFSSIEYETKEVKLQGRTIINIQLSDKIQKLEELVVTGYTLQKKSDVTGAVSKMPIQNAQVEFEELDALSIEQSSSVNKNRICYKAPVIIKTAEDFNTEGYAPITENNFKPVMETPVSTFSIDVDRASYTNVRRYLNNGQLPPADAVRLEEMINYFDYNYTDPSDDKPFATHYEIADCPWNKEHKLIQIGIQGKRIKTEKLPASNLVFLIDVSGSMSDHNKLPLVKQSLRLLSKQLREEDRVAIVVYAGAAGLVLPSTSGDKKETIINALENLQAGGSTAGGAGLQLAYKVAEQNFKEGGNNRIIIATDGDFNVGSSSNADMENLIETERQKGIFISVLGYGMGNYKDDKMEIIADKGNGNYSYIDNIQEAQKTLVKEFGGTLFTIAKDVKLQIEFNPAVVESYRLIGYENRVLNREDFTNDKKDAGDLGAGHTVTALYEIVLKNTSTKNENTLKYQAQIVNEKNNLSELATLKLRYKDPEALNSKELETILKNNSTDFSSASSNFKFITAVTEYGLLLSKSEHKGSASFDHAIEIANQSKGKDEEGYRSEFIRLAKLARDLMVNMN